MIEAAMGQATGWLARLRAGLGHSARTLADGIGGVVGRRRLDEGALEALEELLVAADLGAAPAAKLVAGLARTRFGREVTSEELRAALAADIARLLAPAARPLELEPANRPHVVLVVGVNGTGKTTTIAKLAHQWRGEGRRVLLAACDTFRAAAVRQLEIWAERAGVPVVSGPEGADAAGLAFDALERARREGADVLVIDTAGRLHNKTDLMAQLDKIVRVLAKRAPGAPHDVVLVLDATTGQNAHRQVETFRDIARVSGLIVTKLDGSARGGVVVALAERFGLPVHAVGVGEGLDDLRPFDPDQFARALMGLDA